MNKTERYLRFLAQEAREHTGASRCRLCAMVVYKNTPISIGRNQMKSHPIMAEYGRTEHHIFLHAEIDALLKASRELSPKELKRSSLYVCRVFADGTMTTAKPCPGCTRCIKQYGIENVVWSTYNGYSTSAHEELNASNEIYEAQKAINKHKIDRIQLSGQTCSVFA